MFELLTFNDPAYTPKLVVRLTSKMFKTSRGFSERSDISVLKRKSEHHDGILECLIEDINNDSVNFDRPLSCYDDGIYEIEMVVTRRDWETGYVEEWEWNLIPYTDCLEAT